MLAAVFGKILYVTKENKHKLWRVYYWLGAGVVYSFIFMTIGRTVWLVSFILGLLFLGFYQGVKQKKHYIRNGLLLVLCACMMFPVVFAMTRYFPPLFYHPMWFWGEWSEVRVHSWDAWNSEKYMKIDIVIDIVILAALGRMSEIIGRLSIVQSSLVLRVHVAEQNFQILMDEQSWNQMLIRKTIYTQY